MIDALFDRSRAIVATLLALLVAGVVTLYEIPKEAEPDVDIPVLRVDVEHPGIHPADADRLIVEPLERELRTIEGVEELRSLAYEGGASTTLVFDDDLAFDSDAARALVRERLGAAKAKFPAGTGEPRVREVNLSLFPLILVTLSGGLPEPELLRHARELRDELESRPEILRAAIVGERDERVEVVIDPLVLESYGLDAETLLGVIERASRVVSAGSVDTGHGRLALSVPGPFDDPDDVLDLPVKVGDGTVVRLRDVASVRRTLEDRTSAARVNGRSALAIAVTKRIGANVIETIEDIRGVVSNAARRWPKGIEAGYIQDGSERIRTRIAELRNSLVTAVTVVMAIVIATLGLRSGLLVGIAIPGSFLLAIVGLALLGGSINTAVLYAFVMSVGLLVDGAIVVVENAERLIAAGAPHRDAYRRSVRHLGIPIVTSTATTLAAFLPLLFWPGVVGEYLRYLPLTVLLTLGASLLMALVFVPVVGAALHARTRLEPPRAAPGPGALAAGYGVALRVCLRRPGWVLALGIGLLVWSMWIYERAGRGVEFFPNVEPTSAVLRIHARGELSFSERLALATEVEAIALGYPAFRSVFLHVGNPSGPGRVGTDVIAELFLEFRDWHEHPPADDVLRDLEREAGAVTGIGIEIRPRRAGPSSDKPIQLDVVGAPERLDQAVGIVRRYLDTEPGLQGVEDSRPPPGIDWRLQVDRAEAARYGIDATTAGRYAQLVTKGLEVGKMRSLTGDEAAAVVLRFPARYRTLQGLQGVRVTGPGGTIPLDQFATLVPTPRAGTLERVDGRRARSVLADVEPGVLESEVTRNLQSWLVGVRLPAGVDVRMRGEEEDREEARDFLLQAFGAALALIAIILIVQFNSFYTAFLVLFAIVLATAGVRLGLLVIDLPFGVVMSGIGVIALAGIVVNNNIILIESYRSETAAGLGPYEALVRAGETRLRPVLLTSVTTIAGLTPLVLGIDVDWLEPAVYVGAPSAAYWIQMSSALVFGLGFATLLTLFVTPAALMVRANLAAARARDRAAGRPHSIATAFERDGFPVGFCALTAVVSAWIFIPELVVVRITDIFSKQIFEQPPSRWFQSLEWAAFWSLIVLGAAYGYWKNAHVRVDILRERLSDRGRAWVEIFGFVVLLAPVCLVVLIGGWGYVVQSFLDEEASGALLGSPTQWIFKAMMLVGFAQLLLLGGYVAWKNFRFVRGREVRTYPPEPPGVGETEGGM